MINCQQKNRKQHLKLCITNLNLFTINTKIFLDLLFRVRVRVASATHRVPLLSHAQPSLETGTVTVRKICTARNVSCTASLQQSGQGTFCLCYS